MKSNAATVEEYLKNLPEGKREAVTQLRDSVRKNIPKGFVEEMNYGMIGYVVPLSLYPDGYLGKKNLPLPFINIAVQKNNISFYHMGIYGNSTLLQWLVDSYESQYGKKLDMGKSCLRFKKMEHIPFKLISELCTKISPQQWIQQYERDRGKKSRR